MYKSFYWNDCYHNFQTFMMDNLNTKYMEEIIFKLEIAGDISEWKCLNFCAKFIGYNYFYEKLYEIYNIILIDDGGNVNENNKDKIIYNIDRNTIDKNIYLKDRYYNGNVEYFISGLYELFVDQIPLIVSKEENDKNLKKYILVKKIEKLWEKYWYEPYRYENYNQYVIGIPRSQEKYFKDFIEYVPNLMN